MNAPMKKAPKKKPVEKKPTSKKPVKKSAKAARPKMVPFAAGTHKAYMLRTCRPDMTAHGGFTWPKEGPVSCKDWEPIAQCGNGLHGLLWGAGNAELMNWSEEAVWLVVGIDKWVDIDGEKVKAPGGEVVFCGDRDSAIQLLVTLGADQTKMVKGQASASGDYGQASASGDYGQASASGDYGQASASGFKGQALAGIGGRAAADELGILIICWWDEKATRTRVATGYVGKNGIEVGRFYRVDQNTGQLVPTNDFMPKPDEAAS